MWASWWQVFCYAAPRAMLFHICPPRLPCPCCAVLCCAVLCCAVLCSLCGECTTLVENHDKIRALSHAHRNVSQVRPGPPKAVFTGCEVVLTCCLRTNLRRCTSNLCVLLHLAMLAIAMVLHPHLQHAR
jgi:hypothetical protein